jgi:hypothetical protein
LIRPDRGTAIISVPTALCNAKRKIHEISKSAEATIGQLQLNVLTNAEGIRRFNEPVPHLGQYLHNEPTKLQELIKRADDLSRATCSRAEARFGSAEEHWDGQWRSGGGQR